MATSFTFSPSSGYADITEFSFTNNSILSADAAFYSWDFDDGTFLAGASAVHIFNLPNTYNVTLTTIDISGVTDTTILPVTVAPYLPVGIKFTNSPLAGDQGIFQAAPIRVEISAADIGPHYIDLYAEFSQSAPMHQSNTNNKWETLQPYWRFYDVAKTLTNSILTTDTIIYYQDKPVGVTGFADFYYVDDLPTTDSPIVLWATLQTSAVNFNIDNEVSNFSSYANSQIKVGVPYFINSISPFKVDITSDPINDIYPIQWQGGTIPYLITVKGKYIYSDGTIVYPTLFNFPTTNLDSPITRSISGLNTFTFTNPVLQFNQLDSKGFNTGGFVRDSVYTTDVTSYPTVITAELTAHFTEATRETPFVWIPNPNNSTITNIRLRNHIPDNIVNDLQQGSTQYVNNNLIDIIKNFNTPAVPTQSYNGIYGVAVDHLLNAWVTDSELDRIYNINPFGVITKTIQLSANSTPVGICLDSVSNLYVACVDSYQILKYASDGSLLNIIGLPFDVPALSAQLIEAQNVSLSAIPGENNPIIISVVETDQEDNLWVGYSGDNFSSIIKYDSNGNYLLDIPFIPPEYRQFGIRRRKDRNPVDMLVDSNDNALWVSLAHEDYGTGGAVRKYSSLGVKLSSIFINQPYYLTQDTDNDIWVTFGNNQVQHITQDGAIEYFELNNGNITQFDGPAPIIEFEYTSTLEGIACDSKNQIWILDTQDNRAYIIAKGSTYTFNSFKVLPDANLNILDTLVSDISANEGNTSIQALGDWTGLRWNRKYLSSGAFVKKLTGTSNEFNIYPFKNKYDFRRFNESFDVVEYLKNLPMPDIIRQNNILFDQYFQNAIGGLETEDQSIGRIAYEKIANFVQAHSDVDTCDINQLYSIATELNIHLDDYNLNFPPEIKRLVDTLSISHHRLWGARTRNGNKFKDNFACCTGCKPVNRGEPLNIDIDYVTAGTNIVIKDKYSETYWALTINFASDGRAMYPLLELSEPTLIIPLKDNYQFFTYIPIFENKQVEGVINWDDEWALANPTTTLQESITSIDSWYGDITSIDDIGIIEYMFNYALNRGLGLIK